MNEPTDLIERFRRLVDERSKMRGQDDMIYEIHPGGPRHAWVASSDLTEAADEISTLRDRVAALEGALRPFVLEALDAGAWHLPDDTLWQVAGGEEDTIGMLLTVGDFRNARSVLSPAQGNEFSLSRQQERMDDVARQGGREK